MSDQEKKWKGLILFPFFHRRAIGPHQKNDKSTFFYIVPSYNRSESTLLIWSYIFFRFSFLGSLVLPLQARTTSSPFDTNFSSDVESNAGSIADYSSVETLPADKVFSLSYIFNFINIKKFVILNRLC